jgi:hypothetical protein
MNRRTNSLLVALALVAAAQVASAQGGGKGREDQPVPAAQKPPAGMCRIWLKDVPPAQQPAPTDCASAVRNKPADARVIFSDDRAAPKLPIKSLKSNDKDPPKPSAKPKPGEIKPEG